MINVLYVLGLSHAAQVLLKYAECTSRKLLGTQETKRMMRFATQAFPIPYGAYISNAFSKLKS